MTTPEGYLYPVVDTAGDCVHWCWERGGYLVTLCCQEADRMPIVFGAAIDCPGCIAVKANLVGD